MDKATLQALAENVPKLTKKVDFMKTNGGFGSKFRVGLTIFALMPILMAADLNNGISRLGFTSPTLRNEYKIKPDYLTGTLFHGERKEMPEFKY
jgi:hypothetical protein